MKYYEILRTEREKRKMSQKEVAEKINVKADTYRKYEKGTNEPSLDILIDLANFYNVSMDYLTGRYDIKKD